MFFPSPPPPQKGKKEKKEKKKKKVQVNKNIYLYKWQDLSTVFKCCSLGFPLKILPCRFLLWNGSVFFS